MLSVKDQVDLYILKYKEEVFKHSSNASSNQRLVDELRQYFANAEMQGEKELEKSLLRLRSPSSLARKHLREMGLKVPRRKNFWWYTTFAGAIAAGSIAASFLLITYVVYPYFETKFEDDVLQWNFSLEIPQSATNQKIQGNIPREDFSRVYFDLPSFDGTFTAKDQDYIYYECNVPEDFDITEEIFQKGSGQISFPFKTRALGLACDFEIPKNMTLAIEAENANIDVKDWSSSLLVKILRGNLNLNLDYTQAYNYSLKVDMGNISEEELLQFKADGPKLEIYLYQGNIRFYH